MDAGARPQNRTLVRVPLPVEQAAALDAADLGCDAQASTAMADESAPTGRAELLLFWRRSPSAVELCRGIVDGSATSVPVMHLSEALAIPVYRLVIDGKTRANELSKCSWGNVYAILGLGLGLALGQRVTSDSMAGKKLNKLITCKARASHAAGLDVALRVRVNGRCKDQDRKLRGMTHKEAERHLLLMWDKLPLEFDFSGGAANGGAGASSVALNAPDPQELPLADLSDELGALLALLLADASDEGERVPPADANMEDAAAAAHHHAGCAGSKQKLRAAGHLASRHRRPAAALH